LGSIPAELGPREYFNDLGVKPWCRMLGVQNKCRKYSFGVDLGARIRPAMALDGRFMARRLSANCCRLRHMRQASLRLSNQVIGSAGFCEGMSRLSPKTRARLRTFRYYHHGTLGQNFRSCGRRPIPLPPALVRHNHLHPCRNGAGSVRRLIGRTGASDRKANIAEHAFACTLSDCIIVDEEHVRYDTRLPLRAHDRRAHAVRPMFLAYADCWCWAR